MRATFMLALTTACSLDVASKPECLVDYDCYGSRPLCEDRVCIADPRDENMPPEAHVDVFYAPPGVLRVEGDVAVNDIDAEGDAIVVLDADGAVVDGSRVAFDVPASLPATVTYRITDGVLRREPVVGMISVLPPPVVPPRRLVQGDSVALTPILAGFDGIPPSTIVLVAPPSSGTITGPLEDTVFTSDPDACGRVALTYRLTARNIAFEIEIPFDIDLRVVDDIATVEAGTQATIEVVANDQGSAPVVTAVTSPNATIAADGRSLVVDVPAGIVASYAIPYTVQDARGCTGAGTLVVGTELPTVVIAGPETTGDTFDPVLSFDGRYLAFTSASPSFVTGDTNGVADIFVRDMETGSVERVSIATGGTEANESSGSASISDDGRYVAFTSRATNLDPADTTAIADVYVRDRTTNTTTLVSVTRGGTGVNQPVLSPHLSSTGTRIVFATAAPDLVVGDTNAVSDVFMRDLATATTTRISVDNFGEQTGAASGLRPRISGNGRYIAFSNGASLDGTGTSGVYVTDTVGGTVTRVERGDDLDIDDSGRYVAAAQSFQQRFVDRIVGETVDLPDGYLPSLSANGEYTAYRSVSDRVVAWSRATGALEIARERTGTVVPVNPLRRTEISGDGRWVAFATSVWPGYEGRQVVVRVLNLAAVP